VFRTGVGNDTSPQVGRCLCPFCEGETLKIQRPISLVLAALLCILIFTPASFATQGPASQAEVQVTSEEEMRYCSNQSELFTVYFKLKLTVINKSPKRLIFGRTLSPIARVRIAASLRDAEMRNVLYNPSEFEVSNQKPRHLHLGATPDSKVFVVLNPGQKYEVAVWAGLLADLSKKQISEQAPAMTSGSFVTQVFVRTWPYEAGGNVEIENARNKWSSLGDLLTETIPSNFYPISLPYSQSAPPCDKFKAPK
jgi:hypothetical protein